MKIGFIRTLLGLRKAGWLPWKEADMLLTPQLALFGRTLPRRNYAGLFVLAAVFLTPVAAFAQNPTPTYFSKRIFNITFNSGRDVQMVRLYMSTNQGATWDVYKTAGPSDRGFDIRVNHDGTFWFASQSAFLNGSFSPATVAQLKVEQIVIVDTEPPQINLRSTAPEPL